MFAFAFIVGIYSFIIFGLGITSHLYKTNISILTVLFLITVLALFLKSLQKSNWKKEVRLIAKNRIGLCLLIIFVTQICINLVGVFGPEIGFDALWYHLTLPKLFLEKNAIFHIPGGLLYYSDLPKLGETLYISALSVSNEIMAKFIHFLFGVLSAFALYKISRKYLDHKYALLAVIIFYANLIVGWLSISSYIDLIRTFFEIMAFWAFLEWQETKKNIWLVECALLVGLAISTKLTAIISVFGLAIFIILFTKRQGFKILLKRLITFIFLSFLVPLSYFIYSFINTGNPFYPMFQNSLKLSFANFDPLNLLITGLKILISSPDPISPIYLISAPLIIFYFGKFKTEIKYICIYFLIAFMAIIFISENFCLNCQTGDKTRFLIPYLAIFSISISFLLFKIKKTGLEKILFTGIVLIAVISLGYRLVANWKFVPYLVGKETKQQFLTNNLNFSFGDFYDTDGVLTNKITADDNALLYGFHNLYYVDFPFIDSSWVSKGDTFNYIVTQNTQIPDRFRFWKLIYANSLTKVNLYTFENIKWIY